MKRELTDADPVEYRKPAPTPYDVASAREYRPPTPGLRLFALKSIGWGILVPGLALAALIFAISAGPSLSGKLGFDHWPTWLQISIGIMALAYGVCDVWCLTRQLYGPKREN